MSQQQDQNQDPIDALVSFLRPQLSPLTDSIRVNNFDDFCERIISRLPGVNPNQAHQLCEVLNGLTSGNVTALNTFCNCTVPEFTLDTSSLSKFLQSLKNGWRAIQNNNACRRERNCRTASFLLDTCYDKNKAEKLENALNKLKNHVFQNDDRTHLVFLLLLISSYTEMMQNSSIVAELEWFPILARAAANTIAEGEAYLPLCPSKGDVAALLYYIKINTGLINAFNNNNNLRIGGNDVSNVVQQLIRLS